MAQAPERDLQVLADVAQSAAFASDPSTFGTAVLGRMRRLIACDTVSYNELNLDTRQIRWWTDPPDAVDGGDQAAFERHVDHHPTISYIARTGDASPVKISDFISRSAYHALDLYHDFYADVEIEHQMVVTLAPWRSLIVAFSFNRRRVDFDESERTVLSFLRAQLMTGYRQAQARALATQLLSGKVVPTGDEHLDLLPIGRTGKVHAPAASVERRSAHSPGPSRRELPPAVFEWAAQRQSVCRKQRAAALSDPMVIWRDDARLTLHFLPAREASGPDLLLIRERRQSSPNAERRAEAGLTAREAQVLDLVATGMSNAQIAAELGVSHRTVDKHLQHIYTRLDVSSRTAALAKVRQGDGVPG